MFSGSWARRFRTRVCKGVDVEAEDEDTVEVEARRVGEARVRGVRGEGMEGLRSGRMGRQLDEVERRSFRVVKHDFCTLIIDDISSSYGCGQHTNTDRCRRSYAAGELVPYTCEASREREQ